jgi:hypothetical protein
MRRRSYDARDGAIIFGDLIGKSDVFRVECAKCACAEQYRSDLTQWTDPQDSTARLNSQRQGKFPTGRNTAAPVGGAESR